ncbi:citrate lyase holo-[acyl-carrier protein] synthase [Lactiplantibacillus garii]|uniref:citrate lyase holo-[acyl-carrier protein] synthase n=1 Tax=Lactiplantibacillus garii TaxID=2306423 RepID=A0A426D5H5_9LACO|nr:citrate lyase holo-[acyl-carrier protein] synthase [Lactiplantibacillus garii]RRK09639.1 citrate lyase holo-[acyl-carrier protein] synthase [Lactiplantibacillus garii]
MSNQFKNLDGPEIELMAMLQTRDWRADQQRTILAAQPESTLIWSSTRIPGPVKTGTHLTTKYQAVANGIINKYGAAVVTAASFQRVTGFEFYVLVNEPAKRVKRDLVTFEQGAKFGQLCDLDVLTTGPDGLQHMSREDLMLPRRKCLVCGGDAKVCSRSRAHQLVEMQRAVDEIIAEGWREV